MKNAMNLKPRWTTLLGLSLLLAVAPRLVADGGAEAPAANARLSKFEGTVRQVNATEKTITVKNFWTARTFALGEDCRVSLEGSPDGGLKELQSGHRVTVRFVNHEGVRIAHEIRQENLEYTGHIAALNATNQTLRVKSGLRDRVFTLAPDCRVIFRDGKPRDFSELKVGHRVTVKYLTPDEVNLARSIEQRSLEYTGRVDAIDARTDTVKAGSLVANRTFRLADGCQIVVNDATGGGLKNLRIGDRVTFHYEDVNGVLVANRLELVATPEEPGGGQLTSRKTRTP